MKKQALHHFLFIYQTVLIGLLFVSCGAERSMKKGEQFLTIGEYYDAAAQFKKAYRQTPPKERALDVYKRQAYHYSRHTIHAINYDIQH